MSSISNEQLYNVLLDIKGDIGELKSTSETSRDWIAKQEIRICTLEAGANRQAGAAKVVTIAGTVLGTLGGLLASLFVRQH
jgi:hypothetical protein